MESRHARSFFLLVCTLTLAILSWPSTSAGQQYIYTANFGDGNISGFAMNQRTGTLTEVPGSPFGAGVGPAPITHSPDGAFLYVSLTSQFLGGPCGNNNAELLSYGIDPPTGSLTELQDVVLQGFCSTDVITDPSGKFVYVATIQFDPIKVGNVEGFESKNGALTPLAGSPFQSPIEVSAGQNPAIGSLAMSRDGRVLYASDPNDAAGILIFDRNKKTGALTFRTTFNSGSAFGPIKITASGKFLLAMAPLQLGNGGNGVFEFEIGPHGNLTAVPGSPFTGPNTTAANALSISPNDAFVGFAGFGGVGMMRAISHDRLSPVPGSPFGGGLPAALTFDATGRFLYVTDSIFKVNPVTGVLTKVADFTTGNSPEGITAVCESSHHDDDHRDRGDRDHDDECQDHDKGNGRDGDRGANRDGDKDRD